MLTFEEFSALRQRKSVVSSGLTTDTESHSDQKTLGGNDNNTMGHPGQKLNFGHLMQVHYAAGGRSIDVLKVTI